MKGEIKKWVSALLLLTGCIFFALAGWNVFYQPASSTATPNYVATIEHVNIDLLGTEAFKLANWTYNERGNDASVQAIFVVPGDQCNSCLNDAQSYLEDLTNAMLAGSNISPLIFFQTLDATWVRRVGITYGLQVPILYGDSSVLDGSLSNYGTVSVPCQMVFVDTESSTVFFRALLQTRHSSSTSRRQQVLEQAHVASSNISG